MKRFEVSKLFTCAYKFNRLAGYRPDGKSGASPGIAVHFCQDNATDIKPIVKGTGYVHSILAGHRIRHKKNVGWLNSSFDPAEFGHQLFIHMKTARSI